MIEKRLLPLMESFGDKSPRNDKKKGERGSMGYLAIHQHSIPRNEKEGSIMAKEKSIESQWQDESLIHA